MEWVDMVELEAVALRQQSQQMDSDSLNIYPNIGDNKFRPKQLLVCRRYSSKPNSPQEGSKQLNSPFNGRRQRQFASMQEKA
eukprot:37826-Amphidinium_carterae.2